MTTIQPLPLTERTRIHRLAERQRTDRTELYDILDQALVAHVAVMRGDAPVILPLGFGRAGDFIYLHGSTGSGILRDIETGCALTICVTHLDGLVFARNIAYSSMNYRSAVIFGTAETISTDQKEEAMRVVSEHLMPNRWSEARTPTKRELAGTIVLRIPLTEASVKVRNHNASEDASDGEDRNIWAGVVPLQLIAGEPKRSPLTPEHVMPGVSIDMTKARFNIPQHSSISPTRGEESR